MIIEDDPMVRDLNHRFLERVAGVKFTQIKEVASATLALTDPELANTDLILLDTYMPGISGVDFLQQIRKQNNHAAVIMLTAAADNETVQRTIDYGVTDYLIKPFTFKRFEAAVYKFAELQQTQINDAVDQDRLDELFQNNRPALPQATELPKGLAPNTLRIIITVIEELGGEFTNQQVVEMTNLSRISTRKYLNYLVNEHALSESVDYRKVGRPVTLYQIDNQQKLIGYKS